MPACETNVLCEFIYEQTGLEWLATGGYYLLVKPFRIVLIVIAALILRYAVNRMIKRLTRGAPDGKRPGLLRPLRERMPTSLQEATGVRSERRRQRAESLGSVMRSVASVTVFTVAVMLALAELGVNLAPLIASAGIAGVALGFGAQNLVKDFIAGLFMLLEDQYGVGDLVVYGPLRNVLGMSKVRIAYTGGEAIGPDLFSFYRSLGINLKQLYGQTEASVFITPRACCSGPRAVRIIALDASPSRCAVSMSARSGTPAMRSTRSGQYAAAMRRASSNCSVRSRM